MKSMKRKLLSLFLAMAMVLSLAPTALANNGSESTTTPGGTGTTTDPDTPTNITFTISANPEKLTVGQSVTFTATATAPSGTTIPEGTTYAWTINSTKQNSTTSTCTYTPTDTNQISVSVTATSNNAQIGSGSNTFTPIAANVPVTSVSLNKNTLSLAVGASEALTATVAPEGATDKAVTWSSDNGAVATVNNAGLVTAVAPGSATITATTTDGSKTATCAVTVTAKNTVTLTAPSPSSIYYTTAANGKNTATMKLTNTGDVSGCTIDWSISPAGTVTISPASGTAATASHDVTITAGNVLSTQNVQITARLMKGNTVVATSNAVTLSVNPSEVFSLNPSPSNATVVDLSKLTTSGGYYTFSVNPTWVKDGVSQTITTSNTTYAWTLNNNNTALSNQVYNRVSLTASDLYYGQNNTLACTVTFRDGNGTIVKTVTETWTINAGSAGTAFATATVATSTQSYALGDVDDAGKSSIVNQLDSYFYGNRNNNYYGLYRVSFGSVKDGNNGSLSATANTYYYADRQGSGSDRYLSDVLFYPGSTKGTATFPVTVEYYTTNYQTASATSYVTGVITFTVTEGIADGDITYTGELGKDVYFDLKDFEDFYYDKSNRGDLSYVTFSLPSGGTLYYDGGRLNSSNACYASPSRNQVDLAGVYFSPTGTTATRPSTVRISFTAYGTRTSRAGTVVINYLSGSAKDITYNMTGSSGVSLKVSDFTDAYRQAVGSAAPSGLTIQFQDVPSYGTLTYKDSSRTNASTVTLRSSNIKSYKFTTRTSGTNQLGDVTYTPASGSSRSETISYIAYNGSTPQFSGKVVFNATLASTNMSVTFTGGQTITLNYNEFLKADAIAIASTARIRFVGMPVSGSLTYNGAAVSAAGTDILPTQLGSVVYRANSGFNGTDKITFVCYDASGSTVGSGQVNLIVSGNTSSNGGVTNISQFKDVTTNAWYAADLSTLVSRGIMQGKGEGKFDPLGELKYGEALKIIMLSAGYSAQEGTGKDWAINYKNLAVSNGWISNDIDLDAKISRNAMAELTAKVLGVGASTSASPWTDNANSYAVALYYTSPQILKGNADGTFKGGTTLQRQEICAIASRVLSYKNTIQSTDRPSWLG